MVWFRWGCTASCGWNVRCVGVRGDAWPVLLSPCVTYILACALLGSTIHIQLDGTIRCGLPCGHTLNHNTGCGTACLSLAKPETCMCIHPPLHICSACPAQQAEAGGCAQRNFCTPTTKTRSPNRTEYPNKTSWRDVFLYLLLHFQLPPRTDSSCIYVAFFLAVCSRAGSHGHEEPQPLQHTRNNVKRHQGSTAVPWGMLGDLLYSSPIEA